LSVLIEARDVGMQYGEHADLAVTGVDLDIHERAAVGIVGESGSGKTTLARILVGALRPTSGSVRVDGRKWSEIKRRDPLRRQVQMIFQDPYGSLNPWHTPRQTVAEVFMVWKKETSRSARVQAEQLLSEVGLSRDAIDRLPRQLSGGQCQRVGIARALACDPRVLIADEPTSSLDVSVQAQILNLLLSLKESRGLALLLISHDLGVVRHATDQALVMYAGRVVERGGTDAILKRPLHPYTRILVESIPSPRGQLGDFRPVSNDLGSSAAGCVFAARCPALQPHCVQRPPSLREVSGRQVACFYPLGFENGLGVGDPAVTETQPRPDTARNAEGAGP
jgi:oligopeptide/dipeptide ABC transporter ATP-binding protein